MDLPGHAIALTLGYSLSSYAGDLSVADYVRDGVTITDRGTATLTAVIGDVRLSVDEFSFPNPNFPIFEHQIRFFLDPT